MMLIGIPTASGLGDPIIMYDTYIDRWVMIEFGRDGNHNFNCQEVQTDNPHKIHGKAWIVPTQAFPRLS